MGMKNSFLAGLTRVSDSSLRSGKNRSPGADLQKVGGSRNLRHAVGLTKLCLNARPNAGFLGAIAWISTFGNVPARN